MSRTSPLPKLDSFNFRVDAALKAESRHVAERAADPTSDEAEVMRWIEDVSDRSGWTA